MATVDNFRYKWWALLGLSLLSFTAFLDYTIVATALPFIQKGLHASVIQLQWVTNIFGMMMCMLMIIAGQLGDIFGRRKLFYFGFVLFGIAAIGAGFSQTIDWLIFFRAVQGGAATLIFVLGVALLPTLFPEKQQTRAIGTYTAFTGAGLAVGPFLGGLLITWFSWRWVFFVNIPIILVGLVMCSFSLKESAKVTHVKIDWLGFILLVVGLGCLIFGIIHGEQYAWHLPVTWINLLIGAVSLVLLFWVELKVEQPLLDLAIFKNKHAALAALTAVMAGFITAVLMFFDPLYLKLIRNQTAFIIGVTLLAVPVIQVLMSVTLSTLIRWFGVYNLLVFGAVTAVVSTIMHAFFNIDIGIWYILLALALMGYTWGVANAGSIAGLVGSVPPEKMGSSVGTVFTSWNLSGSVFLALATLVFHAREKAVMAAQLAQHHVTLTAAQRHQVAVLLADPEQAKAVLAKFTGGRAHELYQVFQHSFLSGFHWVAWFATIVMAVGLLLGLLLRH